MKMECCKNYKNCKSILSKIENFRKAYYDGKANIQIIQNFFAFSTLNLDSLCENIKTNTPFMGAIHRLVDIIIEDLISFVGSKEIMIRRNEIITVSSQTEIILNEYTEECWNCKKIITKEQPCKSNICLKHRNELYAELMLI